VQGSLDFENPVEVGNGIGRCRLARTARTEGSAPDRPTHRNWVYQVQPGA
jgi:hypothetical protein